MLKAEHVPEEVLKALAASMNCGWALQTDEDRRVLAEHAAAVINSWPGVRMMVDIDTGDDSALKLPLPQEKRDD